MNQPSKVAAAKGFHYGDANAHTLACFVQRLAVGVHIEKDGSYSFFRPQGFDIFPAGLQVITGVDAEHQHADQTAFTASRRGNRIVAGKADFPDIPGGFQLFGIPHDFSVRDAVPGIYRIDIVDHADVDIIRSGDG